MSYSVQLAVESGATTRFFSVVPAALPAQPDQTPVMSLRLVATGTSPPPPPAVTLTVEVSEAVLVPYQGQQELDSPTVAGPIRVIVSYGPGSSTPPPEAGESRFQLAFFLVEGSLEALRSAIWGIRIDASGDPAGQSFGWVVSDSVDDSHAVVVPLLAARRAAITGSLKVGADLAVQGTTSSQTLQVGTSATPGAAQIIGSAAVRRDSGGQLGPRLTLTNGAAAAASSAAALDFNVYDPGNSDPAARIHALGDGNSSAALVVSTKAPGAAANALAERLRITSAGDAQFKASVTASKLRLSAMSSNTVDQQAPAGLAASYAVTWPVALPAGASALQLDSTGAISASSSFANAIACNAGLTVQGPAALQGTLKVGTAGTAVSITRFTGEPIATMSSTDLPITVPTCSGVKTHVDSVVNAVPSTGRLLGAQLLTGSGTAAPAAGTRRVRLRMVGGGGGGGGVKLGATGGTAGGSGGSSGVLLEIWIGPSGTALDYGTFSCGAGGAGGSTGGGDGGSGADTTIVIGGTTYTAKGGAGGLGMVGEPNANHDQLPRAPAAGTSSGGIAAYGLGGLGEMHNGNMWWGGAGGSTALGAGGLPVGDSKPGNPGLNYGGGGGGAGTGTPSTGQLGGAGAPGCILLEEYS